MLAQRIAHAAEGFQNIGVVGFASYDEQHIGLFQEMPIADRRHRLHLFIGRVAAEIGGDDRRIAQHLGHQRIGPAAKGGGQDGAPLVDHEHI